MRLAFPIWRQTHYRLLTPVIEEALARGLTVECWHDYAQPRDGHKGYQFPDVDDAPKFAAGTPVFRIYEGPDGLYALAQRERVDALIAWRTPRLLFGAGRRSPVPFVMLQDSPGFFSRERMEDADDLAGVTGVGFYSEYWREWGLGVMAADGRLRDGDPRADVIRARSRAIGFPELDACRTLDRDAIRVALGLPAGKPVVTFLPYPFESNPVSFWSRWIYGNPRPWLQAAMIVARGRHRYWRHVRHGWHDVNLVRAVRAFCDANGAALLVKYREKDEIPGHLRAAADVVTADPTPWPPRILEALAVSDLAISFYSATVLESAFLGVPYLCIALPDEGWQGDLHPAWSAARFDTREGGEYNFPGVTALTTIADVIAGLPGRRLSEFRTDAARRRAYVARFLGYDDGRSASRAVDLALHAAAGA